MIDFRRVFGFGPDHAHQFMPQIALLHRRQGDIKGFIRVAFQRTPLLHQNAYDRQVLPADLDVLPDGVFLAEQIGADFLADHAYFRPRLLTSSSLRKRPCATCALRRRS